MVWTGVFTLGFAGYELLITDVLNARVQEAAREEFVQSLASAVVEPPVTVTVPPEVAAVVDLSEDILLYEEMPALEGEPFASISIPKIGVDEIVIAGVRPDDLQIGPGHMPWTPLPGQPGNAVISGHRVTHGRPFFDLDQLGPGDELMVETTIGVHTYQVRSTEIVAPTDVWVTNPRRGAWLTLTTCHPRYSASQRYIVFAELVDGPNLEYAELLDEAVLPDAS